MTAISLRLPDCEEDVALELPPRSVLLLGRDPNASRLDAALREQLVDYPLKAVRLLSQRVSANHLLVYHDGQHVRAWDLQSRNGTWVRVLPGHSLLLPAEVRLTFELAGGTTTALRLIGPKDAQWTTNEEYPAAILREVTNWFTRVDLNARVSISAASSKLEPEGESLLLADGTKLIVSHSRGATVELPWLVMVERIRTYVNEQNIRYEQLQGHGEDFILVAPPMRAAHRELVDAAAYGMRLMLLGPTGAGKDRLARCYHKHSRQHRGPYATVNCALLRENLLYSQLFGAKKGSFTGAVTDLVGVVEAANDGTLFLDEVGDMDLEVQKALLRFLDSRGEYYRLGDTQARHTNVQIVCATNAPLDNAALRHGKFRDDLWYRLAVKVVRVPPLAERHEDIVAYLKVRALRGGQIKAYDAMSAAALRLVLSDPWPGNFRDLENFVERLPANALPGSITEEACSAALSEGRSPSDSSVNRPVVAPAVQNPASWNEIIESAFAAFEEDNGAAPKSWGQLQNFTEKYLKPVFVATSSDLRELTELGRNVNCSEIARRLDIGDGTTVKLHLLRYLERFRRRPSSAK
jgi:DNA-binding NtrC family response regulator